jgi:hypothetical protein
MEAKVNTMTISAHKKTSNAPVWTLNHNDRCDSCGAQAYVEVTGNTGNLLFCAHHYNSIMNNSDGYIKMMTFANKVLDEREKLNMPRSID